MYERRKKKKKKSITPYWLFARAAMATGYEESVADTVWESMAEEIRTPWRAASWMMKEMGIMNPKPSPLDSEVCDLLDKERDASGSQHRREAAYRECQRKYGEEVEVIDYLVELDDISGPV